MTQQLDLEDVLARYPDAPGWKARETSREAAEAIAPKLKGLRAAVYDALKAGAATPEEIAERLGIHLLSARPRFSELLAKGLIKDTGERRESICGKRAIVWTVAP